MGLSFNRHSNRSHDGADQRLSHSLRSVWTLIGICIIVGVVGFIIGSVSTAIWTLVAAGIIVFILRKPVRWLQDRGLPRAAAAGILLIVLLGIIVGITVSFIPLIVEQMAGLANALPGYIEQMQGWWNGFLADHPELVANETAQSWIDTIFNSILGFVSSIPTTAIQGIYTAGVSIANIVLYGAMAFLVAFWILLDYDRMTREVHILAGETAEWYLILISTIFSRVLGGFLRGTIITAIIIAIIAGIGYSIAGLPFAMVLGILMGLFSIVPYIGPAIATIVIALLAIFSGPFAFFVSLAVSIIVPWVASTFISPKIMSSTVNLHPGIIMVAIIAGGAVGGIAGMVLAVPIAAAIKCLIVYFFEAITGRQLVGSDGAVFAGNPTEVIDPVADATDNFLSSEKLRAMVEEVESDVRKVETQRSSVSLFQELAQPMQHIQVLKANDAPEKEEKVEEPIEKEEAE